MRKRGARRRSEWMGGARKVGGAAGYLTTNAKVINNKAVCPCRIL